MGTVIKGFIGIFFILVNVVTGVSIIGQGVEEHAAQNFHADVISEIENSNFAPSVIQSCIAQAEKEGYELTVDNIIADADNNVQMAEVTMKYKYDIDIFNVTAEKEKRGFAR